MTGIVPLVRQPTTAEGVPATSVRGECPSVHAPFEQVDGTLTRVRVPGGALSTRQLRDVAAAAAKYDALIEITNRANLQIRGVTAASHHRLVRDLVNAGVALADPDRDGRRNVVTSPSAGYDVRELVDTRDLVAQVVAHLTGPSGAALGPKFAVGIDGGGSVHVRGRPMDISLGAVGLRHGTWRFELRLGEALPETFDQGNVVLVAPAHAGAVVGAVNDLISIHAVEGGRVTGLTALLGRRETLRQIAARSGALLEQVEPGDLRTLAGPSDRPIGVIAQRQPGVSMVGAMPVLGRLTPATLDAVASVAARSGTDDVRLTPWRSVLVTNIPTHRAPSTLRELEQLGLAVERSDPALAVVACAGSAGCAATSSATQRDAASLVANLRSTSATHPPSVHFSGCSKRCADRRTDYDVTLIGSPTDGTYELIVRDGCGGSTSVTRHLNSEQALHAVLSIDTTREPD